MEKNEVVKFESPELEAIEKSKADQIRSTFEPMVEMLQGFEGDYKELVAESKNGINQDVTARAKRVRIDIGKVRIETGKIKDKQKEYIKLEDRAIMGVHNIIVWAVKEKEDTLKEIENHLEIQEQKRLEALQKERAEKLSKYVEDAHERNLAGMEEDVWKPYFEAKKKEYEDRVAAEKKAESDRIAKEKAEAEERERIRKENERLRKEAEERERLEKIEEEKRAEAERERKAKEDAERREREEKERKQREEHEAQLRAEREAREKAEREEREKREKAEAELQARLEAERKAKEDEEKRIQAELNKGDAAKVKDLIAGLEALKSKYVFKSKKNKEMYRKVGLLIDKTTNFIDQ